MEADQDAVETDQIAESELLMFLFILAFLIFGETFTNMVPAWVGTVEAVGNITNLWSSLSLVFWGM